MVFMEDVGGKPQSVFMWSFGDIGAIAIPEQLAKELQKNITAFWAGDERDAAQWLTNFQRSEGAWQVCVEALRPGPGQSCDEELLQEFCAQTLARLSRSFASRFDVSAQHVERETLCFLLMAHAHGQRGIWKQLALAVTCAYLWTGTWMPPVGDMPEAVRRELLSLPVDLLFCEKGLPLDDARLWQAAAKSLYEGCGTAFEDLLGASGGDDGASVRAVASWLGALRKVVRLLPACDEMLPVQALALNGTQLLDRARTQPAGSAEVALQLARWQQLVSSEDLATMLGPILSSIFSGAEATDCQQLLPLLSELSAGCWPRAALGDFPLDWQTIGESAMAVLRIAITNCLAERDEDCSTQVADAEAALAVWERFAVTVRDGTKAAAATLENLLDEDDDRSWVRPEKRSRVREEKNWKASAESIAHCENLPCMFTQLLYGLLELLRMPLNPMDLEALRVLWKLRAAASSALAAWARLLGGSQTWGEMAYGPLQLACLTVATAEEEIHDDETWRDYEVAFWLSAALARGLSAEAKAAAQSPAHAVLDLAPSMDQAPEPWKTWVLCAASSLAASAAPELCPQMIEWSLARPPSATFMPEFTELTELPFAESLLQLCSNLPARAPHIAVGERLAFLAFCNRPTEAMHERVVEAQTLLLRAMRHAVGGDGTLLCNGLSRGVLPPLCQAVDAEALSAPQESEPSWFAARALFATLQALLPPVDAPSTDPQHPAFLVWKECWRFLDSAMMSWPQCAETEQPASAAVEALTAASVALPGLLPEVLSLLVRSAAAAEMPDLELRALRNIVNDVRCPPLDAARTADLLAEALGSTFEMQLSKQADLLESPTTLAALFHLLSDVVRPQPLGNSGKAPCSGLLRLRMMSRTTLLARCVALVPLSLAETAGEAVAAATLRFLASLLGNDEKLAQDSPLRMVVAPVLPQLLACVFQALVSLQHLGDLGEGLGAAAEFLLRAAAAFPGEAPAAVAAGLTQAQVSATLGERLRRHLGARGSFAKQSDWLEELQQIVCELQREHRKVSHS